MLFMNDYTVIKENTTDSITSMCLFAWKIYCVVIVRGTVNILSLFKKCAYFSVICECHIHLSVISSFNKYKFVTLYFSHESLIHPFMNCLFLELHERE